MIMTSETSDKFFANIVLNLKIIHSKNFEPTIEYKTENPVKVQMQYTDSKIILVWKLYLK